jgi:uncharacterized membrane protein
MLYNPFSFVFVILFVFSILFLFVFVQVNAIALAFSRIGIPSHAIFSALLLTLAGSFINIPIKRIPQEHMTLDNRIHYMGFRYRVPSWRKKETVLAINLGGAVIPVLICGYLLLKTGLWGSAAVATALMILVTHRLARPVAGLGIALPAFLPPILAALMAVIISDEHAAVIAYVAGTLGTLVGADILNLNKISKLGAPVAAIGGAGTFDGIFLNGILAVLLSALLTA